MTDPATALGGLIRKAREAKEMSLTKLAKKCKTSPGQISAIELGKQEANMRTLRKIAEALGMDLEVGLAERELPQKKKKKARE
jgi:transcriptional regulator with XRE-family HTH domain